MEEFTEDNLLDDVFLEEMDFSSLFDFSGLNDLPHLEPPAGEKYLVFSLDEKLYGIDSKRVAEVTEALPITALPNIPEWLAGIANWRGEIISIINLRKLWEKKTPSPAKTRLIIFHPAKNDSAIAFLVDRINEIVTLSGKDINFSASDFENSYPTFFGKADYRSQPLYLLDTEQIFSSLNVKATNPAAV